MIRMTLSALALAVAVALPATSRAQQASPESTTPSASTTATTAHRHHFGRRLFKGVNLTAAEKTQIRAIHEKYKAQIKTARQSSDKATTRSLRTQQLDEMRGVLTPDQQTTFDTNRAALRARAQKHAPQPAPAAAPATPGAAQ